MYTSNPLSNDLINAFSTTIELFGLSSLESRLFAYLYLKDEAQTLDEMSEALGKSKTAMSTSIRNLASLNLVSQVWKRGVRKDLYIANRQLYKLFINFYFRKWVDKTEQQKDVLMEIRDELTKAPKELEGSKELLRRLDEIMEFHILIENTFNELQKK